MSRSDALPPRADAPAAAPRAPRPAGRETWRSALGATAFVLAASLLIGGLTSPAQGFLPDAVRPFANSAGGWSMLAFLAVWASRARPPLGALLGAVSFVAMVEAYGVVSLWRGYFLADPFSSMWVPVGLAAGPVIGLAAALVRHAGRGWAVVGVAVLSLVLVAEGAFGLLFVADTTGPTYWILQIALGVAFLAAAVLRGRRGRVGPSEAGTPIAPAGARVERGPGGRRVRLGRTGQTSKSTEAAEATRLRTNAATRWCSGWTS